MTNTYINKEGVEWLWFKKSAVWVWLHSLLNIAIDMPKRGPQ